MVININIQKHVSIAFAVIMLLAAGYGVATFYAKFNAASVASIIAQPGNSLGKAFWQSILRSNRYDFEDDLDSARTPYAQIVTSVQRRASTNATFAIVAYFGIGIVLALRLTRQSPPTERDAQ
jgi:hypothetical protein